jgi:hypothetical protein
MGKSFVIHPFEKLKTINNVARLRLPFQKKPPYDGRDAG